MVDDYTSVGSLFDYRNQLLITMEFLPFMQLNLSSTIKCEDYEPLPNHSQEYKTSSQQLRQQFQEFVSQLLWNRKNSRVFR